MFGIGRKTKKDSTPKYPVRKLSPEEIGALNYTPPLTRDQINKKNSTPAPDRSHWKDKK